MIFSKQEKQTTLSPGSSSKVEQRWHKDGKKMSSANLAEEEIILGKEEIKLTLPLAFLDN